MYEKLNLIDAEIQAVLTQQLYIMGGLASIWVLVMILVFVKN